MIVPLNLPKAHLKLSKQDGQLRVWCVLRRKSLLLTPEEWVRQHVIHYFVNALKIPQGRIASEMSIRLNDLHRRCDLVVFDEFGKPLIIVECKAPEVPINETVFHQIAHYTRPLQADYLMLTNGLNHVHCRINREKNQLEYLQSFEGIEF